MAAAADAGGGRRQLLGLAALLLGLPLAQGAKPTFRLGSCYGYPDAVYIPAAKVALDDGYFDDILPKNATSAAFTVTVEMVNDQCDGSVATIASLPLLLGVGKDFGRMYYGENVSSAPVVGLIGCECSGAAMAVAAIGNNFKVPMVSGGATSPDLSNKGLYPYFARVIPPDSMQAAAFASLVAYYKWKRVLIAYPGEPYAQGVASALKAKLSTGGGGVTAIEYQFPFQPLSEPSMAASFDHRAWEAIVAQVAHESPQPRVFFSAGNQLDHVFRLFRDVGLVSNQTLWMFADAVCNLIYLNWIGTHTDEYKAAGGSDPWWDYPWADTPKLMRGSLCLTAKGFGQKYYGQRFQAFLGRVNRSAVTAAGWPAAVDGWDDSWFTRDGFEGTMYNPMEFDAMATFVYAIAAMLGRGVPPDEIRGDALRDQIYASVFESITGPIGFNENGDRLAPYDILNMKVSNGTGYLDKVGEYDGIANAVAWASKPVFADGTTNVPSDQPAPCSPGTEFAGAFLGCIPCTEGKAALSTNSRCVNCTQGYFQSGVGQSACQPAPRGSFVAISGALAPTSCAPGRYASDRGLTECTSCAAGSFAAAGSMSACERAPPGTFVAAAGATSCAKCSPGQFATAGDSGTTECSKCAPGTFAAEQGRSACDIAPPGTFVSGVGATASAACSAGQFSAVEGAQECTKCLGGFFQSRAGSSGCSRCDRGSYAPPASAACLACAAGMTTESAASALATDCQCVVGQYCHGTYPTCECRDCPDGMSCPWGAKEQDLLPFNPDGAPLLVQSHYYTKADDPLSVYFCHPSLGEDRCAGGPPESCSDLFGGLTCANCPEGYSPKGSHCEPCSGGNVFVLAIMPIIGVAACIATYYFGNRQVESNTTVTLGISVVFGLIVTLAQLFGTFSQLTMPWPTDVGNVFQGARFLIINPNTVSAHCLGMSVFKQYAIRFIMPYCVVLTVGLCYVVARLLQTVGLIQRPRFIWELPKAVNSVFQIYQGIFIALTAIAVVPYQCYSHPNGKSSLIQFPTVLCGGSEHGGLVAMSVVLLLTFVVPFLGVLVWANVHAMTIRADYLRSQRHLMMFRFLMYRFRPDVWWWGTPFTVRQLLLAFAPMVHPDDPHAQCIFVISVLVIYVPCMCFFWPWKSDELNLLDAVSMGFVTILVAAGSSFMPASPFNGGHLLLMKAVLIVLGVFGGLLFCYGAYAVFKDGLKPDVTGIFSLNEQRLKRREAILRLITDLFALTDTIRSVPLQDLVEALLLMNSYDLSAVHRAIAVFQASTVPIAGGSGALPRRLLAVPSSCAAGFQGEKTRSRSDELAGDLTLQAMVSKSSLNLAATRPGVTTVQV